MYLLSNGITITFISTVLTIFLTSQLVLWEDQEDRGREEAVTAREWTWGLLDTRLGKQEKWLLSLRWVTASHFIAHQFYIVCHFSESLQPMPSSFVFYLNPHKLPYILLSPNANFLPFLFHITLTSFFQTSFVFYLNPLKLDLHSILTFFFHSPPANFLNFLPNPHQLPYITLCTSFHPSLYPQKFPSILLFFSFCCNGLLFLISYFVIIHPSVHPSIHISFFLLIYLCFLSFHPIFISLLSIFSPFYKSSLSRVSHVNFLSSLTSHKFPSIFHFFLPIILLSHSFPFAFILSLILLPFIFSSILEHLTNFLPFFIFPPNNPP